jgi:hypothetical protein
MKNKSGIYPLLVILTVLALSLAGCSPQASPEPPATQAQPALPTDTATPAATATPVPGGPCDNPLVPLGASHQWSYRVINQMGEWAYTLKVLGRRDAANVVTVVEFTDVNHNVVYEEPVVCLDGAIESYPLFVESMIFSGYLDRILDTYQDTGVYAPAYSDFIAKDWMLDWQADYLIEEETFLKNPMGGSDLFVMVSTPVDIAFQTTGIREPASTPSGDFPQALKVVHDFALYVTLMTPGGLTTGTLKVKMSQWYEPYVGLVLAEVDSVVLDTGMIDMPVPFTSRLELTNFTPGIPLSQ